MLASIRMACALVSLSWLPLTQALMAGLTLQHSSFFPSTTLAGETT